MKRKVSNLIWAIKNDELVHISDVEGGLRCACVCPSCNVTLMAKKGEVMTHHFAHYHSDECEHGYETSLHLAAKEILYRAKELWIPSTVIKFDSYKEDVVVREATVIPVDNVRLEKWMDDIVPDVIVESQGKELIIEIFVTHAIDDNKLRKIAEKDISTIEINLSQIDMEIDEHTLTDILLGNTEEKQWKYNSVAEIWKRRFIGVCTKKEIIERGFALHVDNCPKKARMWKGKPYANFLYDCEMCEFWIAGGRDNVLCSGEQFISTIQDFKLPFEKRKEKYLHRMEQQKFEDISNDDCPNCGGRLVDRKSRYGMFKGCSNYPHCRFTLSIDEGTGEIIAKA